MTDPYDCISTTIELVAMAFDDIEEFIIQETLHEKQIKTIQDVRLKPSISAGINSRTVNRKMPFPHKRIGCKVKRRSQY